MEALKVLIRERLLGSPKVAQILEARPELRDDPVKLLQQLEEQGLVEDIFASLETSLQQRERWPSSANAQAQVVGDAGAACSADFVGRTESATPLVVECTSAVRTSSWQLCLRLDEGRAFLDYLDPIDAAGCELQWHVTFGGNRFRSRTVPAIVDPRFDAVMFLALPRFGSRVSLVTFDVPIHLVLTCKKAGRATDDPWDAGETTVVCSHILEWRTCLAVAGPQKLVVELQGIGRRKQLACGVLHAHVELLPVGSASSLVSEQNVKAQLRGEELRRSDVMRRVFEDLDQWWAQYHKMFLCRYVCLFAQTESSLFLPVTSFVTALEAGRALDSPGHAFRWVGLLGTEPRPALESTEPRWHTFPTVWARRKGTIEEKTLLLCSLLLGFSLDAWCCLGTDARGQPHAWVVVRASGDISRPADVVCWDLRGVARISVDSPNYLTSYTSVDIAFNNRRVLVCRAESVARTSFDFSDTRCWLPVPIDSEDAEALKIYSSTRCPPFADLKPRVWALPCEAEGMEECIEERVSSALKTHRESLGFQTVFDQHLAQLLQFALGNCELERVGINASALGFEDIIRKICLEGEVFRAVPVQFNHLRISLFWPTLSDRLAVREALALTAGPPLFAVRARVVVYPEGCVAAWVLLGVRCRAS